MDEDEVQDRTVTLVFPRDDAKKTWSHVASDTDTWLRLLEMILETDFRDYTVQVTQDSYEQKITVVVVFSTTEDAVLFKLQHGR